MEGEREAKGGSGEREMRVLRETERECGEETKGRREGERIGKNG